MKTNTKNEILAYIKSNFPVGVSQISKDFGLSTQIIHRHLKNLLDTEFIIKVGTSPKVYYFPNNKEVDIEYNISQEKKKIINNNFVLFNPDGQVDYGVEGFYKWCKNRNINFDSEIDIYIKTLEKYSKFKKNGLIDGIEKMKNTFSSVFLDEVYYLDFYSIEKYGKTMLGNLMLYGKQTPDKIIISKIISIIHPNISNIIKNKNIDSIAYIPPSIDRKIQLLEEIKKGLNIKLPELKLLKIFKDKVVSQKSLSKKEDRIINARDTIFIGDRNFKTNTILLIDDAVGSGSTLNETAKKIKELNIAKNVIGIAIVGSFKGFEIINEI